MLPPALSFEGERGLGLLKGERPSGACEGEGSGVGWAEAEPGEMQGGPRASPEGPPRKRKGAGSGVGRVARASWQLFALV